MSKPIVAVVGRPNVGKSTLFNKLCGQRLAIVEDTPGITRDRIFANCEWSGHEFLLVDTGGIEPKATEGILAHMREQAQIAIDTADCIIMVVDVRNGLTAADEDVALFQQGAQAAEDGAVDPQGEGVVHPEAVLIGELPDVEGLEEGIEPDDRQQPEEKLELEEPRDRADAPKDGHDRQALFHHPQVHFTRPGDEGKAEGEEAILFHVGNPSQFSDFGEFYPVFPTGCR